MDIRLHQLRLRTPEENVRKAVRRLEAGDSQYSIYREPDPQHTDRKGWISKATLEKIKKLWTKGELDFLLLEVDPTEFIDAVYPLTMESHEERTDRVSARERSDTPEVLEASRSNPSTDLGSLDDLGIHRLAVIDALPSISWSIKGLEEANIPRDRALSLLSEYDELDIKRVSSVVTEYGEEPKRWIKDFRGIDRYVALHYLVLFTEMYQDASFSLLERAATLLAKGLLELDNRLKNAGENLVRYEVWRGPEYLQAYVDATKRDFGTKGQRDRFEKETRALISGIDSKEAT